MEPPIGSVTIEKVDKVPRSLSLNYQVEAVREEIRPDSPPIIGVSIENTSGEPITIETGFRPVFGGFKGTNNEHELLLLRPVEVPELRAPLQPELSQVVFDAVLCRQKVSPGETITERFELYCGTNDKTVFPEGFYRFESTYRYGEEKDEYDWGFSVGVKKSPTN